MSTRALGLLIIFAAGCATRSAPSKPPIDPAKILDLSYNLGPETIYWPTAEPFKLTRVAHGRVAAGGYWYVSNNISMSDHGGTHMDAPIHFGEGKRSSAEVPLSNCIGPACVIDVSAAAARDSDYRMTTGDIENWECAHGKIPRGAIVLMNSGWGARWPDKKTYMGTDKPMDVPNLHFPGYSKAAAELLVKQRDVAALAIDTASIDYGQSKDFIVHQVLNGANKPGFENVANAGKLPPTGATVVALPLKIEGGSGGPTRIIALLP